MKIRLPIASAILVAILILFAIYVWPTRFMYDHAGAGNNTDLLVRINRFTGDVEWLNPMEGWQKTKPEFIDPFATTTPKSSSGN